MDSEDQKSPLLSRSHIIVLALFLVITVLSIPTAIFINSKNTGATIAQDSMQMVAFNPTYYGQKTDLPHIPGELLVRYNNTVDIKTKTGINPDTSPFTPADIVSGLPQESIDALKSINTTSLEKVLPSNSSPQATTYISNVYKITIPTSENLTNAMDKICTEAPGAMYCEPNYKYKIATSSGSDQPVRVENIGNDAPSKLRNQTIAFVDRPLPDNYQELTSQANLPAISANQILPDAEQPVINDTQYNPLVATYLLHSANPGMKFLYAGACGEQCASSSIAEGIVNAVNSGADSIYIGANADFYEGVKPMSVVSAMDYALSNGVIVLAVVPSDSSNLNSESNPPGAQNFIDKTFSFLNYLTNKVYACEGAGCTDDLPIGGCAGPGCSDVVNPPGTIQIHAPIAPPIATGMGQGTLFQQSQQNIAGQRSSNGSSNNQSSAGQGVDKQDGTYKDPASGENAGQTTLSSSAALALLALYLPSGVDINSVQDILEKNANPDGTIDINEDIIQAVQGLPAANSSPGLPPIDPELTAEIENLVGVYAVDKEGVMFYAQQAFPDLTEDELGEIAAIIDDLPKTADGYIDIGSALKAYNDQLQAQQQAQNPQAPRSDSDGQRESQTSEIDNNNPEPEQPSNPSVVYNIPGTQGLTYDQYLAGGYNLPPGSTYDVYGGPYGYGITTMAGVDQMIGFGYGVLGQGGIDPNSYQAGIGPAPLGTPMAGGGISNGIGGILFGGPEAQGPDGGNRGGSDAVETGGSISSDFGQGDNGGGGGGGGGDESF